MKKRLALILALTLVFIMTAAALASANPTTDSTNLTYTVDTQYFVTIPATITIANNTGSDVYKVNATSLIDAGKSLTFTITGATNYDTANSKFRLKNGSNASVFLDYTIKEGTNDVVMDTAFLTATAEECFTGKAVTLTYTTDAPESAGAYTDTVTITIALST